MTGCLSILQGSHVNAGIDVQALVRLWTSERAAVAALCAHHICHKWCAVLQVPINLTEEHCKSTVMATLLQLLTDSPLTKGLPPEEAPLSCSVVLFALASMSLHVLAPAGRHCSSYPSFSCTRGSRHRCAWHMRWAGTYVSPCAHDRCNALGAAHVTWQPAAVIGPPCAA